MFYKELEKRIGNHQSSPRSNRITGDRKTWLNLDIGDTKGLVRSMFLNFYSKNFKHKS